MWTPGMAYDKRRSKTNGGRRLGISEKHINNMLMKQVGVYYYSLRMYLQAGRVQFGSMRYMDPLTFNIKWEIESQKETNS